MERILNLKKGDKVVIAINPSSNASRHINMSLNNIKNWTFDGEVISVGKKYITVKFSKRDGTMKFVIADDYNNNYTCGGADYKLYASFEDVYNIFKAQELYYRIKRSFISHENTFPLEKLGRIMDIIEE